MMRPVTPPQPVDISLPDPAEPYAILEKDGRVHIFEGAVHALAGLDDIHALAARAKTDIVFALPFCAIRERGFDAHGDEPILALAVSKETIVPVEAALRVLPDIPVTLDGDVTAIPGDDDYAALVARFQKAAIEAGHVSQATLARIFKTRIH